MINNQWYIILESREVKRNKIIRIKRFNENMALWRDSNNDVCCISDKCCHRGASLGCGRLIDGKLECPFHGFLYDRTGRVTLIPANGKNAEVPNSMKVRSYPTHEAYGFIWAWYGDDEKISGEPFFFEELKDFSYSTLRDHWHVHYSRAIENQLDVVHLPFVHRTTIGRGNKKLVNGPVVVREGDLITFYVSNVEDDGLTLPLKPEEIRGYHKLFHLYFHFPNLWENHITEKIRVIAAFVPVDDESSIIYIRYYQDMVKIPVLREIMNFIGKISSFVILRQDKRVVITQLPKKSSYKMGERLIQGDLPIIEYRKRRQELIDQNS